MMYSPVLPYGVRFYARNGATRYEPLTHNWDGKPNDHAEQCVIIEAICTVFIRPHTPLSIINFSGVHAEGAKPVGSPLNSPNRYVTTIYGDIIANICRAKIDYFRGRQQHFTKHKSMTRNFYGAVSSLVYHIGDHIAQHEGAV